MYRLILQDELGSVPGRGDVDEDILYDILFMRSSISCDFIILRMTKYLKQTETNHASQIWDFSFNSCLSGLLWNLQAPGCFSTSESGWWSASDSMTGGLKPVGSSHCPAGGGTGVRGYLWRNCATFWEPPQCHSREPPFLQQVFSLQIGFVSQRNLNQQLAHTAPVQKDVWNQWVDFVNGLWSDPF